ncbi:MAG: hypothetical protein ACI9JO_001334, partial [Psychrobacter okhotskensis]
YNEASNINDDEYKSYFGMSKRYSKTVHST